MPIFKKRTEAFSAPVGTPALAAPSRGEVQNGLFAVPPPTLAGDLYRALREAVPVIDAAIYKLMRLTAAFVQSAKTSGSSRFWTIFRLRCP